MEKPEVFYSRGAEKFAEKYSMEKMPQAYKDLLDIFAEKARKMLEDKGLKIEKVNKSEVSGTTIMKILTEVKQ